MLKVLKHLYRGLQIRLLAHSCTLLWPYLLQHLPSGIAYILIIYQNNLVYDIYKDWYHLESIEEFSFITQPLLSYLCWFLFFVKVLRWGTCFSRCAAQWYFWPWGKFFTFELEAFHRRLGEWITGNLILSNLGPLLEFLFSYTLQVMWHL